MKVGIVQSNYIPWRGYFDLIKNCDIFVFLDDVQYTSRDWRNRNYIDSQSGRKLLTVPVGSSRKRLINEVQLPSGEWRVRHFNSIKTSYGLYPYWNLYRGFLEKFYFDFSISNLSKFNQAFITRVSGDFLGIKTQFFDSSLLEIKSKKQARIMEILKELGASHYISGPSGRNYLDESIFLKSGIVLLYIDYSPLLSYPQPAGFSSDRLSIIDLLMNCGPDSAHYLNSKLVEVIP